MELVPDPLGLALALTGKLRGQVVRFEDQAQRAVGSVDGLREKFVVQQCLFPAQMGDRNTLRIGVVVINNKYEKLITQRIGLSELGEGLEALRQGTAIKVLNKVTSRRWPGKRR